MPTHSTPSTLLLLLIVLALAIGPRSALIPPPAFRGAKRRSEKVRSLEKRMGRPLRLKEGGRERDRRAVSGDDSPISSLATTADAATE